MTTCGSSISATPFKRGHTPLRHVPPLEQTLFDYYTRGAYDEYWQPVETTTRATGTATPTSQGHSRRLVRPVPDRRRRVLRGHGCAEQHPTAAHHGPWSHMGMRSDATLLPRVDFGPQSVWGVQRYFDEQLGSYAAGSRQRDRTARGEAPVRIFVMGGGERPSDGGGQARPRRPLARRMPVAARAAHRDPYYLHGDGSLSTAPPARRRCPRRFTFDPAHPVPTIGGLYCSIGELPAGGAGMEQAWARFLSPVLRLATCSPRARRPEGVAGVLRLAGALSAPLRAAGRARLPDRAARGAGRGDGADDRAPLGVLERARHRLHGQARRRLPGERGLPRGLRHAAQRLRSSAAATARGSSARSC